MKFRDLVFVVLIGSFLSFLVIPFVQADQEGPEKVIDNYRITLSLLPQANGNSNLKFYFRDTRTGQLVSTSITMDVTISDSDKLEVLSKQNNIQVNQGIAELSYAFPHNGLYNIAIQFQAADKPGQVYRPEVWALWAPGAGSAGAINYPIGGSEIAGFSLLAILLTIVGINFWQRRKKS